MNWEGGAATAAGSGATVRIAQPASSETRRALAETSASRADKLASPETRFIRRCNEMISLE
jgi:hypothetical protein